jgi:hypothetical protein
MSLSSLVSNYATLGHIGLVLSVMVVVALLTRILYCQFLHPLANFPGPWYATSFSLIGAIVSVRRKEPEFLMYLVRKYGSKSLRLLFLAVRFRSFRWWIAAVAPYPHYPPMCKHKALSSTLK